ncbi:MAG: hypothetical protein ABEJ60_00195 [Halodesulfurarchaeum sp.]
MDYWRATYHLIRVYVWGLTALGLLTVGLLFLPRDVLDPRVAGIWFGLGGFGSLVALIVLIVALFSHE